MTATAVKERPILFSAEMVRAILGEQKTQARRVVKNPKASGVDVQQAEWVERYANANGHTGCWSFKRPLSDKPMPERRWASNSIAIDTIRCPYGQPGDRLWVRETFYFDLLPWADGGSLQDVPEHERESDCLYYRADGTCCEIIPECCCAEVGKPKFRSGRFMPRWASRITLEVTDVRVALLQEISDADVRSEGIEQRHIDKYRRFPQFHPDDIHGLAFAETWNQINSKRGYPWDSNPWVWVVSFKRVTP